MAFFAPAFLAAFLLRAFLAGDFFAADFFVAAFLAGAFFAAFFTPSLLPPVYLFSRLPWRSFSPQPSWCGLPPLRQLLFFAADFLAALAGAAAFLAGCFFRRSLGCFLGGSLLGRLWFGRLGDHHGGFFRHSLVVVGRGQHAGGFYFFVLVVHVFIVVATSAGSASSSPSLIAYILYTSSITLPPAACAVLDCLALRMIELRMRKPL